MFFDPNINHEGKIFPVSNGRGSMFVDIFGIKRCRMIILENPYDEKTYRPFRENIDKKYKIASLSDYCDFGYANLCVDEIGRVFDISQVDNVTILNQIPYRNVIIKTEKDLHIFNKYGPSVLLKIDGYGSNMVFENVKDLMVYAFYKRLNPRYKVNILKEIHPSMGYCLNIRLLSTSPSKLHFRGKTERKFCLAKNFTELMNNQRYNKNRYLYVKEIFDEFNLEDNLENYLYFIDCFKNSKYFLDKFLIFC